MANESATPFKCHIFVCVNDRQDGRKSCADDGGQEIKDRLKAALKAIKLPAGSVRVTQSGCLGICESGPNVMIYPQEILFSKVSIQDVPSIVQCVVTLVKNS